MIIASRDGKRYEITEEDQRQIMARAIANGGDVQKAIEDFPTRRSSASHSGPRRALTRRS
jgi:hypothetical protein